VNVAVAAGQTPDIGGAGRAATAPTQRLAQGVICGPWALAFSFDWARSIVEDFELSPVPKAPVWLLGAANVDGSIIPVIDLALYINPLSPYNPNEAKRLLVGGTSAASNEDAMAIAFTRMPQQLRYEPQSLDEIDGVPAVLLDWCSGYGLDASGQMYLQVDSQRLIDALGDALQS
jgi:chemotaxis signal transduction protein